MEKYVNEEYLKREIMEQSRHLFIYGYTSDYRSEFLKKLEKEYPVIIDSNKPVALYFDSLGIPKMEAHNKSVDRLLISSMSREYISFSIAVKMLERVVEYDEAILNSRLSNLINLVNISKNAGYEDIKTISNLLKEIKLSRDFYYEKYIEYMNGLISGISINDISVPFLQLEFFVSEYKRSLNMDSYLGVIIDKKRPLEISSIMSINNLIGARINGDMSIKVATEPDGWETYHDVNGQFVEEIHDYGTVELDDSLDEYMMMLRKKFYEDE